MKHMLLALTLLTSGGPLAAAPEQSPRPPLERLSFAVAAPDIPADSATLRPAPRPASAQELAFLALPTGAGGTAPDLGVRPNVRSDGFVQQVLFGRAKRRKGSVCGNIDIQGEVVGEVAGSQPGCGARNAVRVKSVGGVALSRPSVMTCDTAEALHTWVERDVEKAFGRSNRVVGLRVAAHYACRTRNNRAGARISEHGKARAIDISGFTLADGSLVTVLKGWQQRATRKGLRKMWKGACGPFGTVLGPEANAYHRDHFHLDTARYRSGSYCR